LDPTQLRWQQFLVAETGGEIVGVGQLRRYGNVEELGSLVVSEAWRARGVGGALVRALIERRRGPLYLECEARRVPYYGKFGFRRLPWYLVPWPLKVKFGLSYYVSRLFGIEITAMQYSEQG
jgi:amino-acid N-acetyltransferase